MGVEPRTSTNTVQAVAAHIAASTKEPSRESQVITHAEQEPRRSVEVQQVRRGTAETVVSALRAQNKSKSIDSHQTGGVSNVHDILRPKGIEVFSQSLVATSDHETPKAAAPNPANESNGKSPLTPMSNCLDAKIDQAHSSHSRIEVGDNYTPQPFIADTSTFKPQLGNGRG